MIMPKTIIFHNTLFVLTFLYLMVSPHVAYADQTNYKVLNSAQIKVSKKITKDDNLSYLSAFINKTQISSFPRLESIQVCSALFIISPIQSLSILSTIRLLL